jgi:hypothetical protein
MRALSNCNGSSPIRTRLEHCKLDPLMRIGDLSFQSGKSSYCNTALLLYVKWREAVRLRGMPGFQGCRFPRSPRRGTQRNNSAREANYRMRSFPAACAFSKCKSNKMAFASLFKWNNL